MVRDCSRESSFPRSAPSEASNDRSLTHRGLHAGNRGPGAITDATALALPEEPISAAIPTATAPTRASDCHGFIAGRGGLANGCACGFERGTTAKMPEPQVPADAHDGESESRREFRQRFCEDQRAARDILQRGVLVRAVAVPVAAGDE